MQVGYGARASRVGLSQHALPLTRSKVERLPVRSYYNLCVIETAVTCSPAEISCQTIARGEHLLAGSETLRTSQASFGGGRRPTARPLLQRALHSPPLGCKALTVLVRSILEKLNIPHTSYKRHHQEQAFKTSIPLLLCTAICKSRTILKAIHDTGWHTPQPLTHVSNHSAASTTGGKTAFPVPIRGQTGSMISAAAFPHLSAC